MATRDRGTDIDPMRVTVHELVDRYLRERRALGRAAKTLQEYEGSFDRYIRPHLGSLMLTKIRPAHAADWLGMLLARGGHDGLRLSPKTAHHAFALLSAAFRWGVRMQLVDRNVCEAVAPPSVPRSEARALSEQEVSRVLAVARGTRWEAFVTLAFALGMRRGELCGLSWSDIDFDAATLIVRTSLSQTRSDGVRLKPTKTNSARTLPLSALAINVLRAHRASQAQDKLRAAGAYADHDAVFADRLGGGSHRWLRRTLLLGSPAPPISRRRDCMMRGTLRQRRC
jgi:integrase